MEKNGRFFSFFKERLTPRATSRPLALKTTEPHDTFETVIYTHWAYPVRSGLTVGLFYVEIEGLSSLELMFDQRVDKLLNLQRKNKLRRVNKIVQKNTFFSSHYSSQRRYENVFLRPSIMANF